MRHYLLVGAVFLAFTGAAGAADLATKAPIAPAAPVFSWTGFYIGANAGYGWGSGSVDFAGSDSTLDAIARGQIPASLAGDPQGFVGGGQAGYNWQTGLLVLGLEADIQWTDIKKSAVLSTDIG